MDLRDALPRAGHAFCVGGSRPTASVVHSLAQWVGSGRVPVVTYAIVYPAVNAVQHLSLSRIPTFGGPCPTTIFTAGLLMLATPR
jgi:Family of unknown function (DUF6064)